MRGARRLRTALLRTYLSADPRSLALGRICLALVLLSDLVQRSSGLQVWYTEQGLLPSSVLGSTGAGPQALSLFHLLTARWQVVLGFLLAAVAYTMLLIGYRTRIAQIASFVCLLSLQGRVVFLQTPADVVLAQLAFWTMFLPTGRCFSLDALITRMSQLRAPNSAPAGQGATPIVPVVSLAVLALLLQTALLHYDNAVDRNGATWREGTALHYLLHQDRIVTAVGLRLRHHMDLWVGKALVWGSLSVEALTPVLILLPVLRRQSRHAAMVLLLVLYVSLALILRLGVYVAAMLAFLPNLIPAADWEALERWWERRPLQRIVVYDGGCGVCLWLMRVVSRLDRARHLRFSSNDVERLPPGVDRELVQQTLLVFDPTTGRRWIRADAVAEVFRVIPGGWPVAILMRLPLVRGLARWAYDRFAQRRADISRALGLDACAVPRRTSHASPGTPTPGPAPMNDGAHPQPVQIRASAREALVAVAIGLSLAHVLWVEDRVPPDGPGAPSGWLQTLTSTIPVFQGWTLFAPDPPRDDLNLLVDATTSEGRRVDPFNEVASPAQPDPGRHVPPGLGQDLLFATYVARIPDARVYHQPLIDWLRRYPERTGRPQDRLRAVDVQIVRDVSPLPGDLYPHQVRVTPLQSWRE